MSRPNQSSPILEITEEPTPLYGWKSGDRFDHRVIEEDLRSLMRRLAEVKFEQRTEREQSHKEKAKLFLAILESMDAFERIFRNIHAKQDLVTPQMKKWVGNFRTIYRMLGSLLEEQGVVRIENLEEGFDPYWHRAMETVEDVTRPHGTIVEEIRPGHLWQGQILRKADVVVVRNEGSEST